ncbi:uncharacterized protein LOC129726174 [Wyeomyia smithii]|uniref:uncharacterized protein LOC129726174 n=1 Tax=Wyeomyia smithii TaxID=174621 RepID=UPI002467BF8E|nr:uncharacterized protein LOC129726174 [Wyeomyia smithii]XP_055538855.1 uncharacterized protein LOC129726174 [Wyeomyia smithii]XP_055538856.1 uncharacterized protein LOC129726174 [Wyeomyia smithii]XP_055538857.1 uncharacterized protein LOC129726174 [Wyeomyia smithii]XP_055538858.1 uncharacterized protein LOC129726174 [Wyeomyia smithii]
MDDEVDLSEKLAQSTSDRENIPIAISPKHRLSNSAPNEEDGDSRTAEELHIKAQSGVVSNECNEAIIVLDVAVEIDASKEQKSIQKDGNHSQDPEETPATETQLSVQDTDVFCDEETQQERHNCQRISVDENKELALPENIKKTVKHKANGNFTSEPISNDTGQLQSTSQSALGDTTLVETSDTEKMIDCVNSVHGEHEEAVIEPLDKAKKEMDKAIVRKTCEEEKFAIRKSDPGENMDVDYENDDELSSDRVCRNDAGSDDNPLEQQTEPELDCHYAEKEMQYDEHIKKIGATKDAVIENRQVNGNVSVGDIQEADHHVDASETTEEADQVRYKRPRSVSPTSVEILHESSNKQLKLDLKSESVLNGELFSSGNLTNPGATEPLAESEKLDQSADSGKSSLGDSNEPEDEVTPKTSELTLQNMEKPRSDIESHHDGNIGDDDFDDEKSSSSSSQSSSSSSSSESDSSDDEASKDEEGEDKTAAKVQHEQEKNEPKPEKSELTIPPSGIAAGSADHATGVAMENNDSQSRLEMNEVFSQTSDEYEEADEEDEINDNQSENDAKITKSEGLKLSISLKRPTAEDSAATSASVDQLPPMENKPVMPQPVDFSNFLSQEKLFGERSELIKIDYNSKPQVHNLSDQVKKMESEMPAVGTTAPAGYFNLINNQFKTNYVGLNSADFLMDESSDTLDEDNRLVIAEKQRRGRKKDISPTKQPQMQQQHQSWLQTGQQSQLMRLGISGRNVPARRSYQQRSQPSLMKTMLASSKVAQQQLPVPPTLPTHLPLQSQQLQQPPILQQQQQLQQHSVNNQQRPQSQPQQPAPEKKKDKKKVFLCSPCGTHYENWNLFKHMREVHKKYICLYCLGIFQSAERLVTHLESKHQVRKKQMASIDDYQSHQQQQNVDTLGRSLYLMCARCEHIFERTTAADEQMIVQHNCANYLEKCDNCGNLKQSKHKCDKKIDLLSSASANATVSSTGNNQKFINNANNKIKFSLNNNYDSAASGSSSAVMFNYDNHGTNSKDNPDNLYQLNSLGSVGKHTNATNTRKSSNKKMKLSQRTKPAEIARPLETNSQLLVNVPSGEDHSATMTADNSFNSPILQSQLMKPLDTMSQLPGTVAYTSEQSHFYTSQSSDQQPFLIQLPSQLMELPNHTTSEQKFSFKETTKLSTIPASLLYVSETPAELPPVPELPSQIGQQTEQLAQEQQQPPLLVPKLKVKIPKQFCPPVESEESSTESDYDDDEPIEETDDGDGKSVDQAMSSHAEQSHTDALPAPVSRIEDDVKLDPVEMDIEEEGDRQPVHLPPEMGPAPMPEQHRLDSQQHLSLGISTPDPTTLEQSNDPSTVFADRPLGSAEPNITESEDPRSIESEMASDAIVVANDDAQLFELTLDVPLDKVEIRDFIKLCLKSTVPFCLYCNHARRIAVNGKYLALHLVASHRFQATVNSITAEELLPATIVQRFKSCLEELEPLFFNLETFDSSWTMEEKAITYPKQFECFQCRFITKIHKELYLHNRKMHQKSLLICLMCKGNFFSYSELLCHMCPGAPNRLVILDYTFRCSLCNIDGIPSAFRLMVHLRKRHFACDVCLEQCTEQGALSNHVWKHKLHHLCYRCGIAYRNKADILKHLFWKHGTEGVLCKRCLQKKWPHVYHFCVPPAQFICEVCQMGFRKSLALKVHQRLHNGEEKYPCTEDGCEKKFISKKLLLKHVQRHYEPPPAPPSPLKPVKEATPEPEQSSKPKQDDQEKNTSGEIKAIIKDDTMDGDGNVKVESREANSSEADKVKTETTQKKKKKRSKKNQEKSLSDLINLPALNLSESDSSDDSDPDQTNTTISKKCANVLPANATSGDECKLSPKENSEEQLKETEEKEKVEKDHALTILNNLKNYQASLNNSRRSSLSEELSEDQFTEKLLKSKILHVSQSDHDYCRMTKKVYPQIKAAEIGETIVIDDNGNLGNAEKQDSPVKGAAGSNPKKQKTPRKRKASKSGSDSSSSGSGSDSDSSCECGSNCSCSSSSSGSSSSSSDDSGSSDENTTKNKIKEVTSLPSEQSSKNEPSVPVEEDLPANPPVPVDPDTIIHESDLETDESETDEEFYDDHPQKLANQMLAEKRRQLLLQTCMSPMNSYGIVENSRPSTPSLPPEETTIKKKVKLKKRKRERKYTKKTTTRLPTPQEPPVPNIPLSNQADQFSPPSIIQMHSHTATTPIFHPAENTVSLAASGNQAITPGTPLGVSALKSSASKIGTPRLSTGNSSESDAPLKRSQRSRKPNKFYGYTSDEETPSPLTPTMAAKHPEKSILSVMKPTPPPNLVWSKEDLPSPPIVKGKNSKLKLQPEQHTPLSSRAPPVATAVINPVQQPPRVEATRIPQVPVHHIYASPLGTPQQTDADSDSSQEGVLQISQKPIKATTTPHRPQPPLPKLKLSISKKGARGAPKTPTSSRKRGVAKPKTPKSAPPIVQPVATNRSAVPATAIPHAFEPPIVDAGIPKVPPLGSFPSITTEFFPPNQIRIPAGWRPPREGESVYCYCRCPYDEVSEMIACDGDNCRIEWFHFECVGIIMPPKGKWFCPECKLKQTVGGISGGIETPSFGSSSSAAVISATATLGGSAANVHN